MARPTDITWSPRIVSALKHDGDPLRSAKSAELAIALKLRG
ncbi:MAG TPA: hypothetical protein VN255_05930 [Mycobacterium sp.]|nr:hypothetical protein [Mycobacterium sp.]HWT48121.1 hypothetical protein [Mycobacterium sp.]